VEGLPSLVKFLSSAEDCPVAERCVGVFPTRCNKDAEGYFYGQHYCGHNNAFLAPVTYVAVAAKNPRYPISFHPGVEVTTTERATPYIFLQFLIVAENGQARMYALVGDPSALVPSPTLLHRYVVLGMKTGTEASFSVTSPLKECDPATLQRLKEGAGAFVADLTPHQLKQKSHGPQPAASVEESHLQPMQLRDRADIARRDALRASAATEAAKDTGATESSGRRSSTVFIPTLRTLSTTPLTMASHTALRPHR
jgi:hypothetical protein